MTQSSAIGIVSQTPFRGQALGRYAVPRAMRLELSVYDRTGRKVKSLASGLAQPGVRVAAWDGRDEQGRSLAAGVYFFRLESADATLTRKTVKLD